jgi:hypothetical protein
MAEQEKAKTSLIQIKMDNGPESSGRRTQFLSVSHLLHTR